MRSYTESFHGTRTMENTHTAVPLSGLGHPRLLAASYSIYPPAFLAIQSPRQAFNLPFSNKPLKLPRKLLTWHRYNDRNKPPPAPQTLRFRWIRLLQHAHPSRNRHRLRLRLHLHHALFRDFPMRQAPPLQEARPRRGGRGCWPARRIRLQWREERRED